MAIKGTIMQEKYNPDHARRLIQGVLKDRKGDRIEQSSNLLKEEDRRTLHMFFSPAPIPKGLTADEACVCVALYEPMADHMRKKYGLRDISENPDHPLLPDELICNGEPMTRERFLTGIDTLLTRISDS